jgi:hypothetical protein
MNIEELSRLVDETAASATSWHILAIQLQRPPAGPDDPFPAFVAAFHYMLYPITEESGREAWGPFAPVFEGPQGVFPPPLPKVDDRWLTLWADVAQASTSQVVRSRLHDLLWERRWGARPDRHARQAIDAYVALTGSSWTSVDRAFGVIRALELARAVKDQERLATVLAACENGARESMIASSPEPGVALRLIRALIWLPPDLQPPSVDDLLAEAEKVYGADPYHFASIVDLKVSRSRDAAFVRQLRIQEVERWRHRAGEAAGLLRFAHLQTALETARNNGLSDLADEIRRDMQKADLGLKQVEAAVPISAEHVETVISTFVDTDDWRTSLRRFGVYGPPSGDVQKNIAAVEQQMRASPLQYLVTKTVLGPDNVPIRVVSSETDHRDVALSEHEKMAISLWAVFAAEILDRIQGRHGVPDSPALTEFFTTPLMPPDLAERVGRAMLLYWQGQPDESAHVLVPRLETTIRTIARECGLATFREPQGAKPGGARALGDLLLAMKERIDESWRRYLWNLLCDPVGVNLRNRVAHGLLPKADKKEAALLIHAACHLSLVQVGNEG